MRDPALSPPITEKLPSVCRKIAATIDKSPKPLLRAAYFNSSRVTRSASRAIVSITPFYHSPDRMKKVTREWPRLALRANA